MFCEKCGAKLEDNAAFCAGCGNRVQGAAPAPQQPAAPQQPYAAPQQPYAAPQQPYAASQQAISPAPITKKSIVTCILLSIVTCGIYGIIWFINMVNDLNTASRDTNATSGGMVFLLSIVTCGIYQFVWFFKAGDQVATAKRFATGMPSESNGVLYLILCLLGLGIVSYCLIQNELNQIAAY